MSLEDFFTLTEMKDGLTAPSRVQELISVMQKEQDSVVRNTGDATRQWAAVASTIAATANKECLDLFIQLDGLWFINKWLNDANNVGAGTNDGSVEEAITVMLQAVEKLYLDNEKSISSEVWVTVSNLLGHHSSKVQDGARVLFDKWKGAGNGGAKSHDTNIARANDVCDKNVREEGQLSSGTEACNDNDHASRLVGGDKFLLRSSDSRLQEKVVVNVPIPSSDIVHESSVSLDCEDIKERSNQLAGSLTYVQENASMSEGEMTSSGTCNLPVPKQSSFKGHPDDLQLTDVSIKEKQDQNDNVRPEKLGAPDISLAPMKPETGPVSIGASKELVKPELAPIMPQPALEHNVERNKNGMCHKTIVSCSMTTPASNKMSGSDDASVISSSNPQRSKASENDDDCCVDTLQNSSTSGINLEKPEALEMSLIKTESVGAVKEEGKDQVTNPGDGTLNGSDSLKSRKEPRSPNIIDKNSAFKLEVVDALKVTRQVAQDVERKYAIKEYDDQVSNQSNDISSSSNSFRQGKGSRSHNIVDKNSDFELEYGIVDALEVARQVAQEVEREIHNSSSEKSSESGIRQVDSSDSTGKRCELAHVPPEVVSSRLSDPAEACSKERHMNTSDDNEAEPECIPELESSQVTEETHYPGGYSEKSLCTFDLNEEVGSDDMDVSANPVSTTLVPFVSASKPAQTSGLPTAPLQFEGTLGWKGSAATSAFRPASPRKSSASERNASAGGNSDISKQKHDYLDFDLNVAEAGEEELVKQIGESSGLPSGQSSVEHSPKRSRKLELDLNSVGDDGDTHPSDQRMERTLFSQRNGYWSSSPASSSSSSSMQPSVRTIYLNNRPCFQTDLLDQRPTKSSMINEAYGLPKPEAPMISILGAKLEVGRREYVPQICSLLNGKAVEPPLDLTMMSGAGSISGMGPAVAYNHSTAFGYNGLTSMPSLSLSAAMYGSGGTIPYMVDSRGTPVGGSSSTVLSSYAQAPHPFIMSMTGTQLALNGVGPSHPNVDLNSGFMLDGGNRETLVTRPFFFPAQSRAVEEHARTLQQSSSSGIGGKRKEPDGGWESYPFEYKHQQPPWK